VDLLPGSPPGSRGEYALVIIDCDGKVLLDKVVTAKKLVRFLWEFRPRVLAVDNIAELGKDRKELVKMLNLLPPETEVVQVTRVGGKFVELKELAKHAGLSVPHNKMGPRETAYALAVLARDGIGTKLKVFEEKTKIIVTKSRTPRAGGSSMSRFVRATKNAVAEVVNEIRNVLEREGFDYDVVVKKSDGDIVSASFTVYAPRKALEGLIKPLNNGAVRVKIRPVVTRRILFDEDLPQEKRYIIIGMDPGTQMGLAVLDLQGNVLYIGSSQNLDRGDIIALVSKFGTPLIVATDTNPPTHATKKLASILKAELFYPRTSLSVKEKEKIAKEYEKKGVKVEDSHQRDALAAAHKALMSVKDKLEKVDRYLDKLALDVDRERIRAEVLRGRSLAELVEEELEKLLEESTEEKDSAVAPSPKNVPVTAKNDLRSALLEAENAALRLKIKEMQDEIERLKLELATLKKGVADEVERRMAMLKEVARQLSSRLEEREKFIEEMRAVLSKAGEDLKALEDGEGFVALYLPYVHYTTKVPEEVEELKTKAVFADAIEDLSDEFLRDLKERNIMIFAKKISAKAMKLLEDNAVPVVTFDAIAYGKYVFLPNKLKEDWTKKRDQMSNKSISIDELEELLREYRASRWR